MANKEAASVLVQIPEIKKQTRTFCLVGESPLILHRMSESAAQELLLPRGPLNAADKAAKLKHEPNKEFRDAAYTLVEDNAPTYLALMSSAFKKAMATGALDLPGSSKAQIGRLVFVRHQYTPIYGKPYLWMTMVRMADVKRTPDIRTRPILPRWAAAIQVKYVEPLLNEQAITNLLTAAGTTVGVGDFRPEKGGEFGQFRMVNDDDPEWLELIGESRAAQTKMMESPEPYDAWTAEMLSWWQSEVKKRGKAKQGKGDASSDGTISISRVVPGTKAG